MGNTLLTDTPRHQEAATAPGIALLQVGAALDVGRHTEQDMALGALLPADDAQATRGSLFVVADGRSSGGAGGMASRGVVEVIGAAFYNSPMRQPGNLLQSAVDQANRRLVGVVQDPAGGGLSSTCVCAAVQGDTLWLANVGDSRAYWLRGPADLQVLSADDLTAPQVLGSRGGVQPHFADPVHLTKGDLILLCSASLYTTLELRLMQDFLSAALLSAATVDPDHLAQGLVEGARFRGAEANISALIIYCADVVPEPVARAGGWPEQQARRLFSPGPALAGAPAGRPATPAPRPALGAAATAAAPAAVAPAADAGGNAERGFTPAGAPATFPADPLGLLIAQVLAHPRASSGDRGGPVPPAGGADPVGQALSAAMGRARQQWLFNLFVAGLSVALVLAGCLAAVLTWLLGRDGLFAALFGSGLGLVGALSWLVTQPAAQLNRAAAQISLLSLAWVNYTQELKGCTAAADPAATAACNDRASAQAVHYFDQIIGGPSA